MWNLTTLLKKKVSYIDISLKSQTRNLNQLGKTLFLLLSDAPGKYLATSVYVDTFN